MTNNTKTVLYLDLERRESEVKVYPELTSFLGGVGVGVKLYSWHQGESPVVFANGPFTLSYPFASFTYTLFRSPTTGKLEDSYLGGTFGAVLALAGYDALVIRNRARRPLYLSIENEKIRFRTVPSEDESFAWRKEGYAGLRAILEAKNGGSVDQHFKFGTSGIGEVLKAKNLLAVVVSGNKLIGKPVDPNFPKVYNELLLRQDSFPVVRGEYASCFGCPLGCIHAEGGFLGKKQVSLSSFLVACPFIGSFYDQVPLVFSLLSVLGQALPHETLEELPEKTEQLRGSLL